MLARVGWGPQRPVSEHAVGKPLDGSRVVPENIAFFSPGSAYHDDNSECYYCGLVIDVSLKFIF